MLTGIVTINRHAELPPVRQIHEAIARAAQDGTLPPGTRLPTVRALADELGIAVITAAKAYRTLREADIVLTRGRAGTVIAPQDRVSSRLEEAARGYAALARDLGADDESVVAALRAALTASRA
ncbi:GntR family transcriptional regulator [Brachybacterium sp. EF45031]|uniref:GntR family transcriptional regulator n=1 Tax=Brachybacterium sillae TaxID=2810536 RepID=UPI00217CE0FA|nr:GntR family transcriptional regulator [Brachybacterium sillae]MCS6710737.1 GntR family transcriptional regulator [Brachybacterium sillae]